MFALLDICVLRYVSNSSRHIRLARRTYIPIQTEKCEGREFEPPLEQIF